MLIQRYSSNKALTPEKFYSEYKKFCHKYPESYTVTFTIINFRKIIDLYGYSMAINTADIFVEIIKEYFPDDLIGSMIEGDFILVTKQSLTEIDRFFKDLINNLANKYIEGEIPVEIRFRSGLSKNDGKDINEDLQKPVIAMFYERSESIYVQYYCNNIEEDKKKQYKYIKHIDELIKQKKIKSVAVDIYDAENNATNLKELRMVDDDEKEIFSKNNIPIIIKYDLVNRLNIYNLEYIFNQFNINKEYIYVININFSIIYKNHYSFLTSLKEAADRNNIAYDHICFSINYDHYRDSTMSLIYITRELKEAGFRLCIQNCGLLSSGYSLVVSAAMEIDYVKVDSDVLIKAMNERRLQVMLKSFIEMYIELDVIPIFTNVSTEGQIEFIKNLSPQCLIRKRLE